MSTFAFVENLRVATLNICLLIMPIVTKDLIGSHDPESDLSIRCLILYLICHCRDPARLVETKGTYWEGPGPESDSDFVVNRTPLPSEYQSLMSSSCLFLNCILVWRTPGKNGPAPKSPQSKLIASNLTAAPLLTYKVCGQDWGKALHEKKRGLLQILLPLHLFCIFWKLWARIANNPCHRQSLSPTVNTGCHFQSQQMLTFGWQLFLHCMNLINIIFFSFL